MLSILPYGTVDDAVAIANDSDYGLSGGVWGADIDEALAVARRLRTGQVEVNGGRYNTLAPFGGYKQSGCRRARVRPRRAGGVPRHQGHPDLTGAVGRVANVGESARHARYDPAHVREPGTATEPHCPYTRRCSPCP